MWQQTCFSLPTLLHISIAWARRETSHTCSIVSQLSFAIVFWTCCLVFSGSLMLLVWGVSATILGFAFSCNLRYSAQIGLYIQCKQYTQYIVQTLHKVHIECIVHIVDQGLTDTTKIWQCIQYSPQYTKNTQYTQSTQYTIHSTQLWHRKYFYVYLFTQLIKSNIDFQPANWRFIGSQV